MNYKNKELAELIANFSLNIKKGDKIYLKYKSSESLPLIKLLIEQITTKGGIVFPYKYDKELEDYNLSTHTIDSIDSIIEKSKFENEFYDIFISVGSNDKFNNTEKNNNEAINALKRKKQQLEALKNEKQWLLLNYPSVEDAKILDMNYDEYYKYAFDAMTFDFTPLLEPIENLRNMLQLTNEIKIIGDNVDLKFYKNNIPAISLLGNINLPDGEIYTAPIKNSINGYIKYNVPSPKNNLIFEDIFLEFKNGKVVDFDCKNHLDEFEKIISIDDGSKYIGEFAFGFNPTIKKPMLDILYDEKLSGSFHMALGNSYDNAFNGNKSALHWDMIYLNKKNNYCDIYFDNELVNSKGLFIPEKIKKLNK